MKKILTMWIIVAFLLVGGLTVIGWLKTKQNKEYYELEKELVASAKIYFGMYPAKSPTSSLSIKSDTLKNENMLKGLTHGEEECNGYVIVKKQAVAYKYNAYIKCKDYTTKKYDVKEYNESDL